METVRIRRLGFPERQKLDVFAQNYRILLPEFHPSDPAPGSEEEVQMLCRQILSSRLTALQESGEITSTTAVPDDDAKIGNNQEIWCRDGFLQVKPTHLNPWPSVLKPPLALLGLHVPSSYFSLPLTAVSSPSSE